MGVVGVMGFLLRLRLELRLELGLGGFAGHVFLMVGLVGVGLGLGD